MWPFTYDDAAGAANRGAGASVARADTNDGDGAAGQAKQDIEVREVDAEEPQQRLTGSGAGLRDSRSVRLSLGARRADSREWCWCSRRSSGYQCEPPGGLGWRPQEGA